MTYTSDVDLNDILVRLNPLIECHAKDSRERDALELAQIALLYIRDSTVHEDFARYCRKFADTPFTVEVSHEFATREEADKWLSSGKAKNSERVKIAGKGFMAVEVTERLRFMVAPLPEELEADEWKGDSE